MRQWRHEPPAPISVPKNPPRIPTQFKYLRSLIFIIASFKNTHISKPLLACQNALKLTYSNVEFQNCSRETPRGGERRAEKGGERKGSGREGRKEGRGGREGRGGVDPWPPAHKTIIRHWVFAAGEMIYIYCTGLRSLHFEFMFRSKTFLWR